MFWMNLLPRAQAETVASWEAAEAVTAEMSPAGTIIMLLGQLLPLLILMAVALAVVIIVVVASRSGSKARQGAQNPQPVQPQQQALRGEAKVITKRVHGGTSYFVGFELTDGSRMELSVTGEQYGLIVEGDKGAATWQGSRLLRFERGV